MEAEKLQDLSQPIDATVADFSKEEMELCGGKLNSCLEKKTRKRLNRTLNRRRRKALETSNDTNHDCPEGTSVIKGIPVLRGSHVEAAVNISSESEAQNVKLTKSQKRRSRKKILRQKRLENSNVQGGSSTVEMEPAYKERNKRIKMKNLEVLSEGEDSSIKDVLTELTCSQKKRVNRKKNSHYLSFNSEKKRLKREERRQKRRLENRKKLLILDVNGLLADIVQYAPARYMPDATKISKKFVFKRPFCDDFLQFCFERFVVGVWSSRTKENLEEVINFLMGDSRHKLLFCWNQSHCTETEHYTIENKNKPVFLKELRRLWEQLYFDFPRPHTAIFPYSFKYWDTEDSSLGPEGDLRTYLKELAVAENVQKYVEQHPFGQPAIT